MEFVQDLIGQLRERMAELDVERAACERAIVSLEGAPEPEPILEASREGRVSEQDVLGALRKLGHGTSSRILAREMGVSPNVVLTRLHGLSHAGLVIREGERSGTTWTSVR